MKFHTVQARNFGPYSSQVTLKLADQGMVLITGDNRDEPCYDSNGAGKSFLLEAFAWCMWGETLRPSKADKIVNRFVGKDCEVIVHFSDTAEYVVTRTRGMTGGKKANDLTFTVDGVDATTGSMKMTQERINAAVGLDFSTFRAMMPGAGLKAAEMTDKQIKELLEDLLQTRVIGEAMELAKLEAKRLDGEIKQVSSELLACTQQLTEEQQRCDTYTIRDAAFEDEREKKILTIQTEVSAQMKVVEQTEKLAKQWKADKEKLELLKVEYDKANNVLSIVGTISRDLATERLKVEKGFDKQLAVLEGEAKSRRLAVRNASVMAAHCPHCQQDVPPEHRQKVHEGAAEQCAAITRDIELVTAQRDLALLELEEKLEEAAKNVKTAEAETVAIQKRMWELQKGEAEYKVTSERWKTAKARIKQLADEQWGIQKSASPFADLIAGALVKVSDYSERVSSLTAQQQILSTEKDEYAFWIDGFSPSGLRSYMLEHVTPVLNARAQYYSELVTHGNMQVVFNTKTTLENGEVREKFNIELIQRHGGDDYGSCSTGEKARADLIIAFALGDLASLRANKVIPFRFLDEPFESIDNTGTEAVVRLLNDQRDKFSTVYVITHKDYFKQLFKNRLTVVKHNDTSTLEYKYGE